MKESCSGWTLTMATLMVGATVTLSSCQFLSKNLSFMTDTVSKAQVDNVVVESGEGGLPTASVGTPSPLSTSAPAAGNRASHYTVQRGDTLSSIARRRGVNLTALCSANGLTRDSKLREGQKLLVPHAASNEAVTRSADSRRAGKDSATGKKKTTSSRMATYKVKPGETLSGIANRHHTTVSAILKANGLKPDQADRIRDGQVLKVPTGR